jgi:hypothetical protein
MVYYTLVAIFFILLGFTGVEWIGIWAIIVIGVMLGMIGEFLVSMFKK